MCAYVQVNPVCIVAYRDDLVNKYSHDKEVVLYNSGASNQGRWDHLDTKMDSGQHNCSAFGDND